MTSKPSLQAATESSRGSQKSADMTLFVQDMLDQMNAKFTRMNDTIMGRMNEMGSRMDELEISIGELMNQAGLESTTSSPKSEGSNKPSNERGSI